MCVYAGKKQCIGEFVSLLFPCRTALGMYDYIKDDVAAGKCLLEIGDWHGEGDPPPLLKDKYGSERRKAKVGECTSSSRLTLSVSLFCVLSITCGIWFGQCWFDQVACVDCCRSSTSRSRTARRHMASLRTLACRWRKPRRQ